jgi:transposase InsO family protein
MFGDRFYIPTELRREALEAIHNAHQGIEKCQARARYSIWWPELSAELQQLVNSCAVCVQNRPARSEPLKPSNFPDRPWQIIGMDLFKHSVNWYLLVADFYSRYPEVYKLPNRRSEPIIIRLKEIFARHGIPEKIRSDNGTQFDPLRTAEFEPLRRPMDLSTKLHPLISLKVMDL